MLKHVVAALASFVLLAAVPAEAKKAPQCASLPKKQRPECDKWVKDNCASQSPLSKKCEKTLDKFAKDCPGKVAYPGPIPSCTPPSDDYTCGDFEAALATLQCPEGLEFAVQMCVTIETLANAGPCADAMQTYFECSIPDVDTNFECRPGGIFGDILPDCDAKLRALGACLGIEIK